MKRGPKPKYLIDYNGEKVSPYKYCKLTGKHYFTIMERLKKGISLDYNRGRPVRSKNYDFYHEYKGEKCSYSRFSVRVLRGMDRKKAILPKKYKVGKKKVVSFFD